MSLYNNILFFVMFLVLVVSLTSVDRWISKTETANGNNATKSKGEPEFNWNTFVPGFFAGGAIVATSGNIFIAILNYRKDKELQAKKADLEKEIERLKADLTK